MCTILTAAYNSAPYLIKWAESIIAQNYRPLSVMMINDQSNDNTDELIPIISKLLKDNDIKFEYLKSDKRLYCSSAYKLCLEKALSNNNIKGEYFGVLDSDDMLEPFACKYIADLYKKYNNIDWIYTQFLWCDVNMKKIRKGFCRITDKGETLLSLEDKRKHCFGHWRTFSSKFRRLDKIFTKDMKCSVDKYMGYRLEEFGKGLFADKICYKYRSGTPKSVSKDKVAIEMWKKVIANAKWRRSKYKFEIFPILKHKG